ARLMKLAIFCKSFRDDLERFARLADSVVRHNRDRLPFYVSVPEADRRLFADALRSRAVEIMTDEEVLGRRIRQSWTTQQLVKLCGCGTGFAAAWLWVDSDAYFIRDFGFPDFVRADGAVAFAVSRRLHVLDDESWSEVRSDLDACPEPLSLAELGRPAF